jgi:hypothetical protein
VEADLGRAAAAAVRLDDSERPPCAAWTRGPESDHQAKEVNAQTITPVGAPDDEILGEQAARRLLEAAGRYTRQALRFPDEVQALRTLVAEVLFENGMLRLRVDELESRVDRLERRCQ